MEHNAEFRRCLLELDVRTMRRLWQHVSPHLPQPRSDDECLETMHQARVGMKTLPEHLRRYSVSWLAERETRRKQSAVGIAVGFHGETNPRKIERVLNVRGEMENAVIRAHADGVDLDADAGEVSRRMLDAYRRAS